MRHRLRKLFLLPCMVLVVFSSIFQAAPAAAVVPVSGGTGSGSSGLSQLQSLLTYIDANCSGIDKNSSQGKNCDSYQSALATVAVCPTPLFTSHSYSTTGFGNFGTKYTPNTGNISQCKTNVANLYGIYQASQTLLNSFLKDCQNLPGKNNQWNTCQNNYQNPLNTALGCNLFMIDKTTVVVAASDNWNAVDKNGVCAGIVTGILDQAALTDCQGQNFSGSDLTACEQGYTGQAQGNTNACSGETGSAATACQQGMDDAGSATTNAGGGLSGPQASTTLSCDAAGDPLNWILCPVFDAVSGFSDWLFSSIVQPLLVVTPLNTSSGSTSYQTWSAMRNIADVLLVIALLVIVFGQSIGGGLVDAYTAKKVLPRLLVAAVLINLSLYLVAALIDITNVLGAGIGSLIVTPINNAGAFKITPSGVQASSIILGVAASAGFAALIFKISTLLKISLLSKAVSFVAVFVIMPVFFGLLAAFITLVLRQAIILALVIISPVAFALYCLPNTEQYFRRWWNFLVQTLMVYPIVILFFAVADVLSVTLYQTGHNNNLIAGPLAAILSFVLQFLPLVFIPYAFRLSGGALGKVHELLTSNHRRVQEGIKGNPNDPNSLRNSLKRNVGAEFTRARAQRFRDWNKSTNPIARSTSGLGAYLTGSAIEKEALLTQAAKQRINAIKDNGDDAIVNARASWVDKDGVRRTLDGKKVSDMEWAAAMREYPTLAEAQAVAEYRATKITSVAQGEEFIRNYMAMSEQQGMSLDETNGAFIGFSFGRQNEFGHLKHGQIIDGPDNHRSYVPVGAPQSFEGGMDSKADGFIRENYSNRNSYAAGAQHSAFHLAMADVKQHHVDTLAQWDADARAGNVRGFNTEEQHAYDELKKITEMEQNFEFGDMVNDPNNPGQVIRSGRGQLTGASAETAAAFAKLKSVGRDKANPGNTNEALQQIDIDLKQGKTWISENTRAPGINNIQDLKENDRTIPHLPDN